MQTIDFNRSYLRWRIDLMAQPAITLTHKAPNPVNNVRINLECRCEILDRQTNRTNIYALCASCKTERVGVQRDCWLQPNADFCAVASHDEFMLLKSWACNGLATALDSETDTPPIERQSGLVAEAWPMFDMQFRPAFGARLVSTDEIIEAIRSDRPIVARTEYEDGDFRVRVDYPVKTINYSEVDGVYQTDTGPILLPDLSSERLQRCERFIECFDLAYSAFNSAGWAEFIVNVPTRIGEGIVVNHYSECRRIAPVENSLFEILDDGQPAQRNLSIGARLPILVNGESNGPANGEMRELASPTGRKAPT